jgi:hypothetical protein
MADANPRMPLQRVAAITCDAAFGSFAAIA